MNLVPQITPGNGNRSLNALLRFTCPFSVSSLQVDAKSVLIGGQNGQLLVYNLEKLRMQLLYEYYASRAGDVLSNIAAQLPSEYKDSVQQIREELMSAQPVQFVNIMNGGVVQQQGQVEVRAASVPKSVSPSKIPLLESKKHVASDRVAVDAD